MGLTAEKLIKTIKTLDFQLKNAVSEMPPKNISVAGLNKETLETLMMAFEEHLIEKAFVVTTEDEFAKCTTGKDKLPSGIELIETKVRFQGINTRLNIFNPLLIP